MRQQLGLIAFCVSAAISTSAQADALGIKLGLDLQQSEVEGNVRGADQGWDDSYRVSGYVAFEHFIPLVPNVMIRHNQQESDGNNALAADLTNTDFVLYYELLDNGVVSLDVGANYRIYDGEVSRDSFSSDTLDDGTILGYAKGQVNLVGTGLFAFVDVSAGGFDDKSISDYQVGLGWNLDMLAIDLNIKGGYRQHSFDVQDWGTNTDLEFSGYFVGAEIHF